MLAISMIMSGVCAQATHALRPLYDPVWFIPPEVPFLWHSALSYITDPRHMCLYI
jgi:hypothetical protein